jgi:molybdopterin molybdotransferase
MKKQLISVENALEKLLPSFSPIGVEEISIQQATNRVLAADIQSALDLPFFTNSSMDGFAVRSGDIQEAIIDNPITLSIIEDIAAGKMPKNVIGENQAARIMTGAPIPEGSDAVLPIEDTDQNYLGPPEGDRLPEIVRVYRAVKPGDYLRHKGEDVSAGQLVMKANSRLRPQDIGLLAMLGIPTVSVYVKPRVVILSTGDELLPVDLPLEPGKIHDSNAYTLSSLISRDGGEAVYLGIVPDKEEAVRKTLRAAVDKEAHLIISSAGVSVGAFDFVRDVVQSEGSLNFWRVNMRPGKPVAFGDFHSIPFIGLPGNPVSAFIGYEVFVRPAISRLVGEKNITKTRIRAELLEDIKSDGRESYLRARVETQSGKYVARLTGHQGSGNLLSLVQANALLIIPSGVKSLPSGTEVEAWLLDPHGNY